MYANTSQTNTGYANDTKTGRYYNEAEKSTEKTATSSGGYDSSQVTEPKATKALPHYLTQAFEIQTADGKTYRVYPYVTKEQALAIEHQSSIILPIPDRNSNTTKRIPAYQGEDLSGYLGGGAYGRVYVGEVLTETRQPTGQFCAVKIIIGDPAKVAESAHEAAIQKQLTQNQAPETSHLMPLIDAVEEREGGVLKRLYYLLPLAALGNVETLRQQLNTLENKELKRLVCWHIGQGLLLGLWQMHKQGIYHLDVKLGNLLVNGLGKVLVADFGTSEKIAAQPPLLTPHRDEHGRFVGNGDSTYFPPERTHDSTFDAVQADVYAAGLALWELATGNSIESVDDYESPENVLRAIEQMSQNSLADVARHLIHHDPKQRWTLEQALNHPIFQAPDLHDSASMSVVLDFLKRFVQQVQLQARDAQHQVSVNELAQSSLALRQSQVQTAEDIQAIKLSQLLNPFTQRPDIQEQLQLYLPLQGSYARVVKDPKTDNFDLNQETQAWLNDPNSTLLLLLADGGSGKSLFTQQLTTHLLQTQATPTSNNNNAKPWLPLYIVLSGIRHPENLLQEGLGLSKDELKALEKGYQLLLILDGYDEQQRWTNLYAQNQLHQYPLKIIITSRLNALPPIYRPFFEPQVPGEPRPRALKEIYVQPFSAEQIQQYVQHYVAHQLLQLKTEVAEQRLDEAWLKVEHYQQQIEQTTGLKELIQTPLLCRLTLEALPELAKRSNDNNDMQQRITRAQVYEAFMIRWINQQQIKQGQQPTAEATEAVLSFGQRIALTLYQNSRAAQIQVGVASYQFDANPGQYRLQPHPLQWFISNMAEKKHLPLQEVQKGQYKFVHYSIQEFLLARYFYRQLKTAASLKDLTWNRLKLTTEEKDRPVLYFLGNLADTDLHFKAQLFALIEQSKTDKTQARSSANAITVLNASGAWLCSKDFKGIAIPEADLSGAVLWGSDLSQADLTSVNLQAANVRAVNFSQSILTDMRLGQWPTLKLEDGVNCCAYSKDGRYLAVAAGGKIVIYDAKCRKILRTLEGHCRGVKTVAFDVSGARLASGSDSYDGVVKLWDVASGKELRTLEGHVNSINSVAFDVSGACLASGSDDRTVRLWDVASGKELRTLWGHSDTVWSVTFDVSGACLASGSRDNTVKLWDVASGKELRTLEGHSNGVTSVAFDGSGACLASGSNDKTVKLWDVASGKELRTLKGYDNAVTSVTFDVSGARLASGSSTYGEAAEIKLWDVASGQLLRTLEGHSKSVTSVAFDVSGARLASGSNDKTVKLWDVASGQELKTLEGPGSSVNSVAFDSSGVRLASGGGELNKPGEIKLWDVASGQLLRMLEGHGDEVMSVTFDANGARLASGEGNYHRGKIRLWDVASGEHVRTLEGHNKSVRSVAFDVSGARLVSGSDDKTVKLWDVASGKELRTLEGHPNEVTSVTFDVSGACLASGSNDSTVKLWDVASGELLRTLEDSRAVESVTFDTSNACLASGNWDNAVKLWDVTSGELLRTLEGHCDVVRSVMSDGSGARLVSGSWDQTVKLWNCINGQCELTILLPDKVRSVSWRKRGEVELLAVGFGRSIGCFRIKLLGKDYIAEMQWVQLGQARLDFTETNLTQAVGLTVNQYELMQQLGAQGMPAKIIEPGEENMIEEFAKKERPEAKVEVIAQQQSRNNLEVALNVNDNSEPVFSKPAPSVSTPPSLLFTQPKPLTSQTAIQQWAQTVKPQGAWTVEREGQNLRIAFDPQHKSTNMTLLLTQLRSHLSQLPEWQHVVAQQQEGNALLIRLNSEANAQAYEVPLKQALGIEEFKLTQSCVVS